MCWKGLKHVEPAQHTYFVQDVLAVGEGLRNELCLILKQNVWSGGEYGHQRWRFYLFWLLLDERKQEKRKNTIRARDEAAAKLYTQLGRICDAIEKRSIILARNDDCSYSIAKVMDMLRSRPGIETGSELFWVATKLFSRKRK